MKNAAIKMSRPLFAMGLCISLSSLLWLVIYLMSTFTGGVFVMLTVLACLCIQIIAFVSSKKFTQYRYWPAICVLLAGPATLWNAVVGPNTLYNVGDLYKTVGTEIVRNPYFYLVVPMLIFGAVVGFLYLVAGILWLAGDITGQTARPEEHYHPAPERPRTAPLPAEEAMAAAGEPQADRPQNPVLAAFSALKKPKKQKKYSLLRQPGQPAPPQAAGPQPATPGATQILTPQKGRNGLTAGLAAGAMAKAEADALQEKEKHAVAKAQAEGAAPQEKAPVSGAAAKAGAPQEKTNAPQTEPVAALQAEAVSASGAQAVASPAPADAAPAPTDAAPAQAVPPNAASTPPEQAADNPAPAEPRRPAPAPAPALRPGVHPDRLAEQPPALQRPAPAPAPALSFGRPAFPHSAPRPRPVADAAPPAGPNADAPVAASAAAEPVGAALAAATPEPQPFSLFDPPPPRPERKSMTQRLFETARIQLARLAPSGRAAQAQPGGAAQPVPPPQPAAQAAPPQPPAETATLTMAAVSGQQATTAQPSPSLFDAPAKKPSRFWETARIQLARLTGDTAPKVEEAPPQPDNAAPQAGVTPPTEEEKTTLADDTARPAEEKNPEGAGS